MNPMLQAAVGAILRWALAFLAGWFVEHGIWTAADAKTYVAGAAIALLTLLWALWSHYRQRLKFLVALDASPAASERQVQEATRAVVATTPLTEKVKMAVSQKE